MAPKSERGVQIFSDGRTHLLMTPYIEVHEKPDAIF